MDFKPYELLQNPPPGNFSSDALCWSPYHSALIPWTRLTDFKDGEGRKDEDFESSFHIRRSKKAPSELTNWTESKTFWCSYGPADDEACLPAIPPLNCTKPKDGPGSRPRARKKLYNNHTKRGCQCHFIANRLRDHPHIAEITYKSR